MLYFKKSLSADPFLGLFFGREENGLSNGLEIVVDSLDAPRPRWFFFLASQY